jgi:hypothetical protein
MSEPSASASLPAFLKQEQVKLAREEVKLALFHLSRYIRGSEREQRS